MSFFVCTPLKYLLGKKNKKKTDFFWNAILCFWSELTQESLLIKDLQVLWLWVLEHGSLETCFAFTSGTQDRLSSPSYSAVFLFFKQTCYAISHYTSFLQSKVWLQITPVRYCTLLDLPPLQKKDRKHRTTLSSKYILHDSHIDNVAGIDNST